MTIPRGPVHAAIQRHFEAQKAFYRLDEEKVPSAQWSHIYGKVDAVLTATTLEQLYELEQAALKSVELFILYAWSKKWAKGPETPERLEDEADSKESFATWQKSMGGEKNIARAKKAFEEAAEIRKRATWLRQQREQSS